MKVLWHVEFTRDYRKFPNFEKIEPSLFTRLPEQCKRFELWRRRHRFDADLSVYFSHFPGFMIPTTDPFFDFHVNILERRHQAFVASRNEDAVILLTPGILLEPEFNINRYIEKARTTGSLVSVTCDKKYPFGGLWVIPRDILTIFSRPLPADARNCDDIAYWRHLANRNNRFLLEIDKTISNYLPQYAGAAAEYVPTGGETTDYSYVPWTLDDFRAWEKSEKFIFAKTMRWCPHEYVYIWKRNEEETKKWLMAIDFLYRHSRIDQWYSRFQIASFIDGSKYWNCGTYDLENRTNRDLQRRIYLEDGKDEYGNERKKPAPDFLYELQNQSER
ncbi:MAG: hypothetical protein IKE69_06475 [Thermoguttaceae bacterium]|nr:hypothetical protein [Thermoguttaceae bacterium]